MTERRKTHKVTDTANSRALGMRIRAARKARGMSQQWLAEEIGFVSDSTISWLESGRMVLKSTYVPILCHVLDITPNYLFGFEDKESRR